MKYHIQISDTKEVMEKMEKSFYKKVLLDQIMKCAEQEYDRTDFEGKDTTNIMVTIDIHPAIKFKKGEKGVRK